MAKSIKGSKAKASSSRPDYNDPKGGAARQAESSAKSADSGTAKASGLSQKSPYPVYASEGASSAPKAEAEMTSLEGYTHKTSHLGTLQPFSTDQSAGPEGYSHPVTQGGRESPPITSTTTHYDHTADPLSGPPVTKPGIPKPEMKDPDGDGDAY